MHGPSPDPSRSGAVHRRRVLPRSRSQRLLRSPSPRGQPRLRRAGRRPLRTDAGGPGPGLVHAHRGGERQGPQPDDERSRPAHPDGAGARRSASVTVTRSATVSTTSEGCPRRLVLVPEGDTIHRTASAIRTALVGRPMVRFDAPRLIGPVPQAGRTVETVESHGKHLEITWDDGLVLHTHMRMSGSWHLYRAEEPWRRPYHQLRAAIETTEWVAVCFNAPIVETYREPDRRRHPGRGRLGPDLCKTTTDLADVVDLVLRIPGAGGPTPRRDARSTCDVWGRQRLPLRGAVGDRAEPVGARRRPHPPRRGRARQHRGRDVAGRRPHRPAGHEPRRPGWTGGVRTQRSGLRAVPRDDRRPPRRRARPVAVLVRRLSGPPRPTPRRRLTARWTPTRPSPSSCPTSPGAARFVVGQRTFRGVVART